MAPTTYDEFIVKVPFKHGLHSFNPSPHLTDPSEMPRVKERSDFPSMTREHVKVFHEMGWISIPGLDDKEQVPGRALLVPKEITVDLQAEG